MLTVQGRPGPAEAPAARSGPSRAARRRRTALSWLITGVGGALVWFALVGPDELSDLAPAAFVRLPLEGLVLAMLAVVLPPTTRVVVAVLAGTVLGLLAVVKVLDLGFRTALDRPFDPLSDAGHLGSALDLLADSIGRSGALLALCLATAAALTAPVLAALAVLRLGRLLARHRRVAIRAVAVLGVAWGLLAWSGIHLVERLPVAATSGVQDAYGQVRSAWSANEDRQRFARRLLEDPLADVPAEDLLTRLRGKDVLVVFVESYGRVAVEGSQLSDRVRPVLDGGTRRLRAAGFGTRSTFLTSPTFGGISWLAHATLQSGLWVDDQPSYNALLASDRMTLSRVFARAGWRTVAAVPANREDWPQGRSFYGFEQVYDSTNLGYAGPEFSYATMPDQYLLSAFGRLELAGERRRPVMAEIDLVSSHTPWVPLPSMVPWHQVGDGSVFAPMPARGPSTAEVWPDPSRVRAAYAAAIVYSLQSVISFVETYGDDDLVMVVLGDHQPATVVTGPDADHDVPISVITRDRAVLDQTAGWGWQPGLRPAGEPLWPMDQFRDRFVSAFSATGLQSG